ncbi:MAG: hypothetical protein A2138_13085 [Deltaproteobacteria bacterium RBG_16_71_12]|nr:MAG: hypothetical protein A2138_13085 [Deltaproteobacteria bacterium RBG_16_71_12]
MKKQDIPISSLVDMAERGELQLPEIQRRYVWRAPRVRDLLDSLYRGYPSGSILVWETDDAVPTREIQVHERDRGNTPTKLLLDGQQRVTSLSAVLRGKPVQVRGRKKPIDILFNLEHPDGPPTEAMDVESDQEDLLDDDPEGDDQAGDDEGEPEVSIQQRFAQRAFIVSSKALAQQPSWVSVSRVFASTDDAEFLERAGIESFKDPRYAKYTQRLQKLRAIASYPYVMHVLERDLSYEEVAEIFVRVNSLGVKLRASDLALAKISSRWRTLLDALEEFQEECEQSWFTLDTGLLVRAMVVLATQQCKFKSVGGVPVDHLSSSWDRAKDGLRYAINFLRTNAGIEDESLLSSPFLMIPIAVVGALHGDQVDARESRDLLYWLLVANARGRYSRGSSETMLNEDLALLFNGAGASKLLDNMSRQFGRLHVDVDDIAGRNHRSPFFSLAFLALKARGAKDWHSGLGLSLTHQGKLHYIEHHHIFPRALLRKAGFEPSEINEIANLAFISGKTNRRIADKDPAAYLADVVKRHGEDALRAQVVPTDRELHAVDRFRDFIADRRRALVEVMNAHLQASRG